MFNQAKPIVPYTSTITFTTSVVTLYQDVTPDRESTRLQLALGQKIKNLIHWTHSMLSHLNTQINEYYSKYFGKEIKTINNKYSFFSIVKISTLDVVIEGVITWQTRWWLPCRGKYFSSFFTLYYLYYYFSFHPLFSHIKKKVTDFYF